MAIFTDVICDATKEGRKLPTSEYKSNGKYPIIDQGQNHIAGYTDETEGLFSNVPAIIFGDHTRIIKYVDTPFFIGADGVKILKAKDKKANHKFLYYALSSAKIPNTGYNRHFKWLKEIDIPEYSAKEQNDIVVQLEKIDDLISVRKQQLYNLDELVKSRFVELFGDIHAPSKWEKKPWSELVTIQNGRDYKNILVESGGYPVYGTGGEMARASEYLCPENTIIVGRKGTINNPLLVKEKFWNVDTAFGVIVGNQLNYQYFYNFCRMFDFSTLNKQAVLPSTTKADLLKIEIAVPPMELQNQFAAFVEQTDKSKLAIQHSLEKLETMKKALMQKYFGWRKK